MEREQIIKALECCTKDRKSCKGCPINNWNALCVEHILKNALALITSQEQRIGELTEENEGLREFATIKEIEKEIVRKQTKADTVREMQERLDIEAVPVLEPRTHLDYLAVSVSRIDKITKEMLEGDNEN